MREKVEEKKSDTDLIMETLGKVVTAITELKEKMNEVIAESRKWYRAGKFSISFILLGTLGNCIIS